MTLEELNSLTTDDAFKWFEQTCAAQNWIEAMVANRPYKTTEQLCDIALSVWNSMQEADYRQAFEAHPMIGDVNSLRAKFANTKTTAASEQQGTSVASDETLQALSKLNHEYLAKHGFIFIICATGLSAETMLNELEKRLPNDTQTELSIAAGEQIKITLLRLNKGLTASSLQESTS